MLFFFFNLAKLNSELGSVTCNQKSHSSSTHKGVTLPFPLKVLNGHWKCQTRCVFLCRFLPYSQWLSHVVTIPYIMARTLWVQRMWCPQLTPYPRAGQEWAEWTHEGLVKMAPWARALGAFATQIFRYLLAAALVCLQFNSCWNKDSWKSNKQLPDTQHGTHFVFPFGIENEIRPTLFGCPPGSWHKREKGRGRDYPSKYVVTWRQRGKALLWVGTKGCVFCFFFLNMFLSKGRRCQRKCLQTGSERFPCHKNRLLSSIPN